jgi:hypothetical protein
MADNEKLKQLLELYKQLSDEEKASLASELAEDDELMTLLLNILTERNQVIENVESDGVEGFINFLRKVKE